MKFKMFRGRSKIVIALLICIAVFAVVFYANLRSTISAQQNELNALKKELAKLQQENIEIDYLINEADETLLFERLARERGYVYPDEKIFYDVTVGK